MSSEHFRQRVLEALRHNTRDVPHDLGFRV